MMADAKEKAKNHPPVDVVAPDNLTELAFDYNAYMAAAKSCLEQLLGECVKPGGPRRVEFSTGRAWSNIPSGNIERIDLVTANFVDPHISYISKIGA